MLRDLIRSANENPLSGRGENSDFALSREGEDAREVTGDSFLRVAPFRSGATFDFFVVTVKGSSSSSDNPRTEDD